MDLISVSWRIRKCYGQWGLWRFPRVTMWNETFKLIMFYFNKFDQGKADLSCDLTVLSMYLMRAGPSWWQLAWRGGNGSNGELRSEMKGTFQSTAWLWVEGGRRKSWARSSPFLPVISPFWKLLQTSLGNLVGPYLKIKEAVGAAHHSLGSVSRTGKK